MRNAIKIAAAAAAMRNVFSWNQRMLPRKKIEWRNAGCRRLALSWSWMAYARVLSQSGRFRNRPKFTRRRNRGTRKGVHRTRFRIPTGVQKFFLSYLTGLPFDDFLSYISLININNMFIIASSITTRDNLVMKLTQRRLLLFTSEDS